jgi:hypothetical protein
MYALVYTLLIILYLLSAFFKSNAFDYAVGAVSIIALLLSSIKARGLYLYTGFIFLLIGIILFLYNGLPVYEFLLQFQSMLGLLSLFLVLLFINSLIYIGRFDKTIKQILQLKMNEWGQLYERSTLASHLFANFLNIATIPLLVKSLRSSLSGFPASQINSFCSRNLLRSYALALTWSPTEVMVSSSIDITKTKYVFVFPIMVFLTIIIIFIDMKLSYFRYRSIAFISTNQSAILNVNKIKRKIMVLAVFLLFLIAIVSFVQLFIHQSFLFSVVLVLPFYTITWAQLLKKRKSYLVLITTKWKAHAEGISNYFFMFLSAGLFVKMISTTGWSLMLQSFFYTHINQPFYFYLLTAAFFMITSLTGFHPLVAITIFSAIIQPMTSQLSALPLTVVLIACSLSTVMYSPFNLSVSLLSNELKVNPYKITAWNIGFAVFYILLSIGLAEVIQKFMQ